METRESKLLIPQDVLESFWSSGHWNHPKRPTNVKKGTCQIINKKNTADPRSNSNQPIPTARHKEDLISSESNSLAAMRFPVNQEGCVMCHEPIFGEGNRGVASRCLWPYPFEGSIFPVQTRGSLILIKISTPFKRVNLPPVNGNFASTSKYVQVT